LGFAPVDIPSRFGSLGLIEATSNFRVCEKAQAPTIIQTRNRDMDDLLWINSIHSALN